VPLLLSDFNATLIF